MNDSLGNRNVNSMCEMKMTSPTGSNPVDKDWRRFNPVVDSFSKIMGLEIERTGFPPVLRSFATSEGYEAKKDFRGNDEFGQINMKRIEQRILKWSRAEIAWALHRLEIYWLTLVNHTTQNSFYKEERL